MSDFFLSLSRSHIARTVVKQTGIPIPLPQNLRRQRAPWQHATLAGRNIAMGSLQSESSDHSARLSTVEAELSAALLDAGANLSGEPTHLQGLVFDSTNILSPESLHALYEFFHHRIGKLTPCAHLLILGRAVKNQSVAAATQEALSGFVRSLAKELGGRGITVNLLLLPASGEHAGPTNLGVDGVIRYLLSDHGSFVTGQVLHLQDRQYLKSHSPLQRFENLLEGRTILVTGAAQGIGAAIARRVAAEGAKVLLLDRPEELKALEAMAREVQGLAMPIDLLQPDAVATTVKKLRELAPIHGVVHNAGITRDKTLFKMNRQKWDSVLRLNFEIPVAITEMVTGKDHDFICAKDASFVYLSSVGGIAGNPGQTNYAASKAGLIGYVKALASAQDNNSAHVARGRFNCVAPGFIETRMTEAMPLAVREVARRFNSLKQAGEPDDVAQAVTFLLSDAAMAINGETLRVCGQNFVGQ